MNMNIVEIYERTKANCSYYEREGKRLSLLNEIGVLRGVAYCLEVMTGKLPFDDSEFMRLIDIQKEMKNQEDRQWPTRN